VWIIVSIAFACVEIEMPVFGYCLMPNHFHLVVRPREDGDLSRWMQWLFTAHVRRYHKHYQSSGTIWQEPFKAFPIQQGEHLLTALRCIERNPVRARGEGRGARGEGREVRLFKDPASRPIWFAVGRKRFAPALNHGVSLPSNERRQTRLSYRTWKS